MNFDKTKNALGFLMMYFYIILTYGQFHLQMYVIRV